MPTWWNSVESVGRFNTTVLACAAALGFLAAFFVVASWFTGTRLATLQDSELDRYKKDADVKIVQANALSEAAKADAPTARAQIAASEVERARLGLRLKQVETAHSRLAATNAENEQEIVKLKESQKPRNISAAQGTQISALLKPFSGQTVKVQMYGRDNETGMFANQVVAVLQNAGLKTEQFNMLDGSGTGFMVVVHDAQSVPPLAGTIQHAFKAAGIDVGGLALPDVVKESGQFVIAVGEKPKSQ